MAEKLKKKKATSSKEHSTNHIDIGSSDIDSDSYGSVGTSSTHPKMAKTVLKQPTRFSNRKRSSARDDINQAKKKATKVSNESKSYNIPGDATAKKMPKADLQLWLTKNGIDFDPSDTNKQLTEMMLEHIEDNHHLCGQWCSNEDSL